jgi:hypothetical protein
MAGCEVEEALTIPRVPLLVPFCMQELVGTLQKCPANCWRWMEGKGPYLTHVDHQFIIKMTKCMGFY